MVNSYDVAKFLGQMISTALPKVPYWVTGAKKVVGEEEWINFRPLLKQPASSRTDVADDHYFIEIACFSKHGHLRKDKLINRPWQLAESLFDLVHQKDYRIDSSCLRFREARLIYQDARSIGAFAQNIQQQSPLLDIHSVHIEVEAVIMERRT